MPSDRLLPLPVAGLIGDSFTRISVRRNKYWKEAMHDEREDRNHIVVVENSIILPYLHVELALCS